MVTGSGTSEDPYVLYNLSDLEQIPTLGLNKYYKLANDIDASATQDESYNSGEGWNPIGTSSSAFSGYFDGDGHTIDGIYINRPSTDNVGLFGYLYTIGKYIKNVKLTNVDITGNKNVGGLAGQSYKARGDSNPIFTDIEVNGTIVGNGSCVGGIVGYAPYSHQFTGCIANIDLTGNGSVGGIVGSGGYNYRTGRYYVIIDSCCSTGTISSTGENNGGIIGYSQPTISNCYSTVDVVGGPYTGGCVGYAYYGTISNCYSMGSVNGGSYSGGFLGYDRSGTITNCYSCGLVINGLGFCGGNYLYTTFTSCYWDTETSNKTSSNGGVGKTTLEMKTQSTYVDWDFETVWNINSESNSGYPSLIAFLTELTVEDAGGIDSTEIFGCDPIS